jgi:hypothetical protein
VNESQVFANALKLATPAERAAYLDAACAGDPQLRAAVEGLLRAQVRDPDFLELPVASLTATPDTSAATAKPRKKLRIGRGSWYPTAHDPLRS